MVSLIQAKVCLHGLPVAVCFGLTLYACSGDEPRQTAPPPPKPAAPVAERRAEDSTLSAKCALPDTPRETPQFDFDRAELRPRGRGILDTLATCLTSGPLKGESVTIVGRADPRGPERYNRELGQQRARAARDYLVEHGVASTAITVESAGERAATGTDPAGWQLDRRVEIRENMQSRR